MGRTDPYIIGVVLLAVTSCRGRFDDTAPVPTGDSLAPLTAAESPCDDGLDGDLDGAIDCLDPDCIPAAVCAVTCPEQFVGLGTVRGSTLGLGDEYGDDTCGGVGASDIAVAFTAPHTGAFRARTTGTNFDAVLRVWSECGGPELSCLDLPLPGAEILPLWLEAGQTALLILDGSAPEELGNFSLTLEAVPEAECGNGVDDDSDGRVDCDDSDCAQAVDCLLDCADIRLSGALPATVSDTTPGAGRDQTGTCGFDTAAGADVVVQFTAPTAGRFSFDTFIADFDTVLYALDGCEGAELACADDTLTTRSRVVVDLTAGQDVLLVVDGDAGAEGGFTLTASEVTASEVVCDDHIDDDVDGWTDCADPDCDAACGEICDDGIDDDGDGLLDCADSSCSTDSELRGPLPGSVILAALPGTLQGSTVDAGNHTAGSCGGGFAEDTRLQLPTPIDGRLVVAVEAEFDGALVVADTCGGLQQACVSFGPGTTTTLIDGPPSATVVAAVDGLFAGDAGAFTVTATPYEPTEATCDDGLDNDVDGQIDCADADCGSSAPCTEDCTNALDDDANGLVDCLDLVDCFLDPACAPTCPDLFATSGATVGATTGRVDVRVGSCDTSPAPAEPSPEQTLSFTAPSAGTWLFALDATTTDFDSILYVLDGCGGAELGCDDRFFPAPFGGEALPVSLTAGQTVTVVVDGYDGAQGDYTLVITPSASTETRCDDGVDDDADGDPDCYDDDCEADPGCAAEVACDDDFDNDGDFRSDCADSDCVGTPPCLEDCTVDGDEDRDGLADCDDPDCSLDPACPEDCTNGTDDDGDGDIDCGDAACDLDPACLETACTDGLDNDGSGDADCLDPDCALDVACAVGCPASTMGLGSFTGSTIGLPDQHTGSCDISSQYGDPPATSDHSVAFTAPSDGTYVFALTPDGTRYDTLLLLLDGCGGVELGCQDRFFPNPFGGESLTADLVAGQTVIAVVDGFFGDSGDFELVVAPLASSEICGNGVDDDDDFTLDCFDYECFGDPACAAETVCDDLVDQDGDFDFDCFDADCAGAPACQEDCTDGLDNDADFDIDCADADCLAEPACAPTCPHAVLGAPPLTLSDSTVGLPDQHTPSCSVPSVTSDLAFEFTAPATGTYTLDTFGSRYDTVLYVLDSCGGAELACNDDTAGLQSELTLDLVAGETVLVVVDGYAQESGSATLTIR